MDSKTTIHSCLNLFIATVATLMLSLPFASQAAISGTGSDSTYALVKALADAYSGESGVEINLAGGGSSHGAQSCIEGTVDFGFLSRKLKRSEMEKGLNGTSYAMDGVAVVVNPNNPVTNLTLVELAGIYSGEQNWSDDKVVVPFNRNEDSGTREVFEGTVMKGKKFRDDAKISHDQLMLKQVSRIPTAIGYTSAFHVSGGVKTLQIEGIAPTHDSILDGSYPISRTLTLAKKEGASAEVDGFINFVKSEKGAKIITDLGYIPIQ